MPILCGQEDLLQIHTRGGGAGDPTGSEEGYDLDDTGADRKRHVSGMQSCRPQEQMEQEQGRLRAGVPVHPVQATVPAGSGFE